MREVERVKQSSFVGEQAGFLRGETELEKTRYTTYDSTKQQLEQFLHCCETFLRALLALHSPPTMLQRLMVLENELLEVEVSLEGDVVLQVG